MAPTTLTSVFASEHSPTPSTIIAAREYEPTESPIPGDGVFTNSPHTVSEHTPSHAALISGLAVGSVIALALVLTGCWAMRHRIAKWYRGLGAKKGPRSTESYAFKSVDNTPSTQASEWEVRREYYSVPLPAASTGNVTRSESTNWTRHDLRQTSDAPAGAATYDPTYMGAGLGMRSTSQSQHTAYTSLNPDSVSAPTTGEQRSTRSVQRGRQYHATTAPAPAAAPTPVEAPAQSKAGTPNLQSQVQQYMDRSLPASPSVSSMPMPPTTPATTTSASQTSPVGIQTPFQSSQSPQPQQPTYTPSLYQPYPPTSLAHPGPSNATKTYPYAPASSHSTLASLTHPHFAPPPPSLPQPYSTISLGSTAEIYRRINSNMDLYRGLSSRQTHRQPNASASVSPLKSSPGKGGGGASVYSPGKTGSSSTERPPWDYLSAEEAVGGGWRNSTGGVSGWETVRDGDDGDGVDGDGAEGREGK